MEIKQLYYVEDGYFPNIVSLDDHIYDLAGPANSGAYNPFAISKSDTFDVAYVNFEKPPFTIFTPAFTYDSKDRTHLTCTKLGSYIFLFYIPTQLYYNTSPPIIKMYIDGKT